MDLFEEIARESVSVEVALVALHKAGASPIEAIKAVRNGRQISLSGSKEALCNSPAWKAESEAADRLHQTIIDALDNDEL